MPNLQRLALASNALTGTLPSNLAWPSLNSLVLSGMPSLHGTVPATWCMAPFAPSIRFL